MDEMTTPKPFSKLTEAEKHEMSEAELERATELDTLVEPDDRPVAHGPTDTDEHDVIPAPTENGLGDAVAELRERIDVLEAKEQMSPPTVDATVDQLAYRVLFLEAATTILYNELRARGFLPRGPQAGDEWLDRIERQVRVKMNRHLTPGRGEMIAANLAVTRDDDEDFRT